MKPLYIKFSDERNKKYSIKTIIVKDEEGKYVVKEPIFPEGTEHIENIVRYAALLKQYYSNVEICPVQKVENKLIFEFISGKSLLDCYKECLEKKNVEEYKKLLQYHKECVLGSEENRCIFHSTPEAERVFGALAFLDGAEGIKVANFDATASNILICGNKPLFIDYEWVCEFPIPQDLAVYHCVRDSYLHLSELEQFFPLQEAVEVLGIKSEVAKLEEAYVTFFKNVIREENGQSFAEKKITCLKRKRTIKEYIEDNRYAHTEWQQCAENWKESCKANEKLNGEIENIRIEWEKCAKNWEQVSKENERLIEENKEIRKEWEQCAKNWKRSCEENERLTEENKEIRKEWEQCAKNWEGSCEENKKIRTELEEYEQKYQSLKEEYAAVADSRSWKIINTLKGGKK